MSFLTNPPLPHRPSQVDPSVCLNCYLPWPCPEERRKRDLEGKVPAWTEEDERRLRDRVRRRRP